METKASLGVLALLERRLGAPDNPASNRILGGILGVSHTHAAKLRAGGLMDYRAFKRALHYLNLPADEHMDFELKYQLEITGDEGALEFAIAKIRDADMAAVASKFFGGKAIGGKKLTGVLLAACLGLSPAGDAFALEKQGFSTHSPADDASRSLYIMLNIDMAAPQLTPKSTLQHFFLPLPALPVDSSLLDRRPHRPPHEVADQSKETDMASVSTYLNFPGNTEAAFLFYRTVFGTEFDANGIMRMGDVPPMPDQPPLSDADRNLVMHVCLPILGGHLLMGTDAMESMGQKLAIGNNSYINLQPDTRAEADALFAKLSAGGKVEMPMQDMFWGDYFGSLVDQYGVQWMVNCASKA